MDWSEAGSRREKMPTKIESLAWLTAAAAAAAAAAAVLSVRE